MKLGESVELGANLGLAVQRDNFVQQKRKFLNGPKPSPASCLHAPAQTASLHREPSLSSQSNNLIFLMLVPMLLPPTFFSANSQVELISLPSPGCPGAQITYMLFVDFG